MAKRFLILANPIAGGGRARHLAPRLAEELARRGARTEVCFSQAAGDLAREAARVCTNEFDAVVSVGGDGTLNEVLNGLPDPSLPLCAMAVGTSNVLATELHLPRRPDELAGILVRGHTLKAAIGLCEGRRFLLFVSAGVDATIVERVASVRTGTLGKLGWVCPILNTARHWPNPRLSVRVGGRELGDVTTALVSRVRNYGGILKLPASVDVTDGHLHVLLFRQRSRSQYLRAALRGMSGRLRPGRDLELLVSNEVEIRGHAPYQVDGDLGGTLPHPRPLRIGLSPESARLFAGPAMIPR